MSPVLEAGSIYWVSDTPAEDGVEGMKLFSDSGRFDMDWKAKLWAWLACVGGEVREGVEGPSGVGGFRGDGGWVCCDGAL